MLIKKMFVYARKEARERERERERERKIKRWKYRERFEREMGENYCVLEKLNHLMISKACNLTADQIDHLDSFYHRLRFLAIVLKDMDEKQQQHEMNFEAKSLSMQIYYVICKTRQLVRSFDVEVSGQRDSFFDIFFGTNIMEEIETIEAKVVQFYDQIYQIQLLQDEKSFNDEVQSSMSTENRTTVEEEIMVGFDDEALTIEERLIAGGGKRQLQMIKERLIAGGKRQLQMIKERLIAGGKRQLQMIKERLIAGGNKLLQMINSSTSMPMPMSMSMGNRTMVDEEITVGFEDDALAIKELLAGENQQLQMISIVGMPGLGKTTLARKLYNDPYITYYFHIRAWTYASQLPTKREMLLDILRSFNVVFTDEIINMTNEKLGEKLYKQLKGNKYLIVIDDLWDIGAWVDLKMYFPNDNNGSRVMFTSRLKELAMHASPDCHPHSLRFLTEEESWELLQQKVFQNESCPPELIIIGKQIVKKCAGLPLAIVVIAGLLARNIKTQESWKQVAQSVSSYIVSDPNQYLDTLALSYNHLPHHLKPCFLYLGAFPEDQEISVQKLIWLWIAEGFIQKIEQKSLEEVAEGYLMELIQRSLVIVAQNRFDGRIKTCRMHDLLRDLCLKKAREINFLKWIHNYDDAYPPPPSNYKANNQCHLCFGFDFLEKCDHVLLESYSPLVVQSLLCFRNKSGIEIRYRDFKLQTSEISPFGDVFSFICCNFKLLRVLDIWYINAFFSRELTQLVNLRYLAINLIGRHELPPSISNLSNLETLIIICTERREVILPCNVWNIAKLRNFYAKGRAKYAASLCSEEVVTDHNHPYILENLRTIANLDHYGSIQDLLARTPYLTKLGICGQLISESGNSMFPNLEFLGHLETLKLQNNYLTSNPTTLGEVKFPANIRRLTLKNTGIEWEEISVLGMMLPNLELLKLEKDAARGQQWATTDGGFPRLKFLKLEALYVERWITCSDHFPSLQHLSLGCCHFLEEIPSSLGEILTLQLMEVNSCRTVGESVRKIKEEQESIGNNWLKVLIRERWTCYSKIKNAGEPEKEGLEWVYVGCPRGRPGQNLSTAVTSVDRGCQPSRQTTGK
ncbi:unnamed protein product [Camellia sinensis]